MHYTDDRRIHFLDLLRFLSALSVMFFHYALILGCYGEPSSPFGIFRYGMLGVSVFFIISGFVISMSAEGKAPKQFVISRICRLYPAYWVCCTLTFLCVSVLFRNRSGVFERSIPEYLINLGMFPQFVGVRFVDGVYWSLEFEIIFYFFIFALLLLAGFERLKPALFCWALITLLNLFPESRILKMAFLTDYSHFFILGAVYYLAMEEGWDAWKILLAAPMFGLSVFRTAKAAMEAPFACPWVPAVVLIALVNLVFILISLGKLRVESRALCLFGETTYPLYLLHGVVGALLLGALPWSKPVKFMAVSAGMIAAAFAIARFIERPARKWLKPRLERFFEVVPAILGLHPAYWQRKT